MSGLLLLMARLSRWLAERGGEPGNLSDVAVGAGKGPRCWSIREAWVSCFAPVTSRMFNRRYLTIVFVPNKMGV